VTCRAEIAVCVEITLHSIVCHVADQSLLCSKKPGGVCNLQVWWAELLSGLLAHFSMDSAWITDF
jgi:hypothetical protein